MGQADRFRYPGLRTHVEVVCPAGHPRVLRCHPLHQRAQDRVDGDPLGGSAPFPTLFWLACDDIVRAVSALEHAGLIGEIEERMAADPSLRKKIADEHRAYIAERWAALSSEEVSYIEARGFAEKLRSCGIGGIRNFEAVKCLHLHYAHHLARGSSIGALVEARLDPDVCRGANEPDRS